MATKGPNIHYLVLIDTRRRIHSAVSNFVRANSPSSTASFEAVIGCCICFRALSNERGLRVLQHFLAKLLPTDRGVGGSSSEDLTDLVLLLCLPSDNVQRVPISKHDEEMYEDA